MDKAAGDEVFAGTLNGTGSLRVRISRRAEDSVVARIVTLVEQAGQTKPRTQLFIEKVEQRYSIGMVAATVAIFVLPLLWDEALQDSLLRAMTFMIVASPCAVVLATMPSLLAVIANAGRHGVLAKSAVVLEQPAATTQVAFDKTGTLTRATPELAAIRVLPGAGITETQLLRLAAAAERPSEHPSAAAVVAAARARGLDLPEAEEFSAQPGRGVSALVDGHFLRIGSPAALMPTGTDAGTATAVSAVEAIQGRGQTAVLVLNEQRVVAVLAITDQTRPEAAATVTALTRLTGTSPVLLTGDNHATATRLAEELGIRDVRAGLLPADKVTAVRELEAAAAAALGGLAPCGRGTDRLAEHSDVSSATTAPSENGTVLGVDGVLDLSSNVGDRIDERLVQLIGSALSPARSS